MFLFCHDTKNDLPMSRMVSPPLKGRGRDGVCILLIYNLFPPTQILPLNRGGDNEHRHTNTGMVI